MLLMKTYAIINLLILKMTEDFVVVQENVMWGTASSAIIELRIPSQLIEACSFWL